MQKRALAMVVLIGLLLVGVMAGSAIAAEPAENYREYSEIRENASDVAADFLPDEFEIAGFFDWIIIPLVGLGVLITGAILIYYLSAQPRFAREVEERSRR